MSLLNYAKSHFIKVGKYRLTLITLKVLIKKLLRVETKLKFLIPLKVMSVHQLILKKARRGTN